MKGSGAMDIIAELDRREYAAPTLKWDPRLPYQQLKNRNPIRMTYRSSPDSLTECGAEGGGVMTSRIEETPHITASISAEQDVPSGDDLATATTRRCARESLRVDLMKRMGGNEFEGRYHGDKFELIMSHYLPLSPAMGALATLVVVATLATLGKKPMLLLMP